MTVGWAAVAVWMAAVAVASLAPVSGPHASFVVGADKWVHLILHAVLGWLAARAAIGSGMGRRTAWGLAVGLALAYGAGIEAVQSLVGRDPSLGDWIADAVGGVVGAGLLLGFTGRDRFEEAS